MTWELRESSPSSRDTDVAGTLFCVGNGSSTTRGANPEDRRNAYRGVFISGLYTRAPLDNGFSSVGAKNLTGDWYRGGVFWDMDVFQLPMLVALDPARARNHILYRIRRLDMSRRQALQDGYEGARYTGTSYDTGLDDPPCLGGLGRMEIHVSFEVAWGIAHYYYLTGDDALMLDGGREVVLEITKFWASRIQKDQDGSYHLRGICGPDELHKPVDDNAYTNTMIRELMKQSVGMLERLSVADAGRVKALCTKLAVNDARIASWKNITARIHVPMIDTLRMEQYAGHSRLPEPNRALVKANGMGADKVPKQADTILLFQNHPAAFSREEMLANYREYAPLCNQTSSLSYCTHALVAARLGMDRDTRFYLDLALGVHIEDSMGNTSHGIHGAGEGGIWMAIVHGVGGLTVGPKGAEINPRFPPWWKSLKYGFFLASQRLRVLPWNCIGVEDAETGIEAIRRAGMLAVAVGSQAGEADLVVGGVDELSVDVMRQLFAEKTPTVNPYLERNIQVLKGESKWSSARRRREDN